MRKKTPQATQIEQADKLSAQDAQLAAMLDGLNQLLQSMTPEQRTNFYETQLSEAEAILAKASADRAKVTAKLDSGADVTKKIAQSLAVCDLNAAAAQLKVDELKGKLGIQTVETVVMHMTPLEQKSPAYAELDAHFATRSYTKGYSPSQADQAKFLEVGSASPPSQFVHAGRWHRHIASFGAYQRSRWPK